ncbi:hypothetical protein NC653_038272 [Populus alba x Populus x berolinensis]|uniref:Uncharacterized protein n=1 Tax=Populus alba x Populus x berolinensis TaxID=444605 RepID=A0AAD6LHT0_9ROSI|nr:hypothetical protein NC653_038272 [Populus alba x Populus x berolinensis]
MGAFDLMLQMDIPVSETSTEHTSDAASIDDVGRATDMETSVDPLDCWHNGWDSQFYHSYSTTSLFKSLTWFRIQTVGSRLPESISQPVTKANSQGIPLSPLLSEEKHSPADKSSTLPEAECHAKHHTNFHPMVLRKRKAKIKLITSTGNLQPALAE